MLKNRKDKDPSSPIAYDLSLLTASSYVHRTTVELHETIMGMHCFSHGHFAMKSVKSIINLEHPSCYQLKPDTNNQSTDD